MRNDLKWYMVFLTYICLFVACEVDIPIELPEQEELLGAYVLIDQTNDTATVLIERTLRFEETLLENQANLEGPATVKLKQGINQITNFTQEQQSIYYKPDFPAFDIEEGLMYEIEIEHPDFETMEASEESISDPVEMTVEKIASYALPDGRIPASTYILAFEDPLNKDNYYQLGARRKFLLDGVYVFTDVSIFNNYFILVDGQATDLEFISVSGDLFISDESFDGKLVQILIPEDIFSQEPDQLLVRNLSESHYNFMRFLDNNDNSDFTALLEAVPIYSNFDRGFGVFGFYTEQTLDLD